MLRIQDEMKMLMNMVRNEDVNEYCTLLNLNADEYSVKIRC